MEIDWRFLGWFIPLVAGAGLTFLFGWLDSTLKHRRERRVAEELRVRELADKQRGEGREHALAALAIATKIRDRVAPQPIRLGEQRDPIYHFSAADWDAAEVRELRDVGILIPDATIRDMIAIAANFVTAGTVAADGIGWRESGRAIQLGAMVRLRNLLGAYLRIEELDPDAIAWFREVNAGLLAEWDKITQQLEDEAEALDS